MITDQITITYTHRTCDKCGAPVKTCPAGGREHYAIPLEPSYPIPYYPVNPYCPVNPYIYPYNIPRRPSAGGTGDAR